MTIGGWILFVVFGLCIVVSAFGIGAALDTKLSWVITTIVTIIIIFGIFFGMKWYYNNTASGQRALVDQKSEISSGLDRTVTVYTADGQIIAQYTGKIDIEGNNGGYVLFDFEGKRYTYYNCFVESIADIK